MPIKWRLVLLSSLGLFLILALFHLFVYFLFENLIIQTEQHVIEVKLASLSRTYEAAKVNTPLMRGVLESYVEKGQALRVVIDGRTSVEVNKGIPRTLYLSEEEPMERVQWVREWEGREISILSIPLGKAERGRVEMYTDFSSLHRYLNTMLTALMIGSTALMAAVVVGGYIMSTIALRPVSRITQTVRELDPSKLDHRLEIPATRDEIEALSRTFNELLDRIHDLIGRQKRFVADASHELRTPVAVIRGYVNLLKRWGWQKPEIAKESLEAIDHETSRMEKMTERLLQSIRMEAETSRPERVPVDLRALVKQRVERWRRLLKNHRMECSVPDEEIVVNVSRVEWEELLDILIDNAGKYTPKGGTIAIRLRSDNRHVMLTVSDTGQGIPSEELNRVFSRFYQSKRNRRHSGSGLGLAIARQIVEAHGGRIEIVSEWGKGTHMNIIMPYS